MEEGGEFLPEEEGWGGWRLSSPLYASIRIVLHSLKKEGKRKILNGNVLWASKN